jgi:putative ABC transport system permease protein
MNLFLQDARFALRGFRKNPAFAAIAIFTLAVGIGANTSIFSVANALLLRQLPYPEPERLALLSAARFTNGATQGPLSWTRFQMVHARNKSFAGIAAFTSDTFNWTGSGRPEQLNAARVSWDFFQILGIRPALGRWFNADEDTPGGNLVAVLSHELWSRRFGASPAAIGRTLTLNDKVYTVAGVLPAGFRFDSIGPVDIVVPRVFDLGVIVPAQLNGGAGFLNYLARLRPGVSFAQAQAEMDTLAAQYRREYPKFPDADPALTIRVGNLRDELVLSVRTALWILFGAVGLVLLIACANVASLLLSRALGRKREIAVRTAIGATRASLIRQLLTESLLLAAAGGLLGALLSAWGTEALAAMAARTLPRAQEIHADAAVFAFTAIVSMVAGVLFGLAPALQISRPDVNSILRAEGRGSTAGRRRNTLRGMLAVAQVAISVVLLIGAGLLLRNFVALRDSNPGFRPGNLLTMQVSLPASRYPRPAQAAFYRDLVRNIGALPGVESAAGTTALPLNASRFTPALPEGQPEGPLSARPLFNIASITPGYAQTMGIPVLRGREFTVRDDAAAPKVLLINQTLARLYWPNEDAVGKHILVGRGTAPLEVVGVLGDVRNMSLAADVKPEIYFPYPQLPGLPLNLVVRTATEPHTMVRAVEGAVFALDANQPVTAVQSMDEILDAGAAQPRFTTSLLGGLSLTALVLAIVGIYGVIAYSVTERTQEMGIRIALGASRGDILGLVLRQGMTLAGAGIAIGIVSSLALTRLLTSLLYGVSATDPLTFVFAAGLFVAVAFAASSIPAMRATRVDPIDTLR